MLGGEEGRRHAQAPSPRGVQSCQEPRVLGAQLQATDSGGHAAGASVSPEMWMLSPNYTFLRSCPPGRFQDILLRFLEQFPVLFAKEGIVAHQELLSPTLRPRELTAQPPAASPQTLPDGASPHVHHAPQCLSQHGADLSPLRFLRRKVRLRASCLRVSGELQAEPNGCKVLLTPLALPIAPETGALTDTLTHTLTHTHTLTNMQTYKQNIHTTTTHTQLTHTQTYKQNIYTTTTRTVLTHTNIQTKYTHKHNTFTTYTHTHTKVQT